MNMDSYIHLYIIAYINSLCAYLHARSKKPLLLFQCTMQSFIQATSNVLRPNNSDAWKEIEKVNQILYFKPWASISPKPMMHFPLISDSPSFQNISQCRKKIQLYPKK